MFYPVDQGSNDFDMILDHVEGIISGNMEKEHKLVLLKAKIEELKMWFNTKSLSELERLKFKIEDIEEPSLSDLNSSTNIEDNEPPPTHKGIELPPTNEKVEEEIEETEEA